MRCAKNDLADDLDTVMGETNVFGSASRRKCQMCPDDLYHLRRCSRTTSQLRSDGVVPLGQGFMALQSQ